MDPRADILTKIDAFLAEKGMSEGQFGRKCARNHKLIPRLRRSCNVTVGTLQRIEAFMRDYREGIVHDPASTRVYQRRQDAATTEASA